MAEEMTLDELETRLAGSAAELLKTVLRLTRLRAENQATVDALNGLEACELKITAVRSQIQLKLLADIDGATRSIYTGTFSEQAVQGLVH